MTGHVCVKAVVGAFPDGLAPNPNLSISLPWFLYRYCYERVGLPPELQFSDVPLVNETGVKWLKVAPVRTNDITLLLNVSFVDSVPPDQVGKEEMIRWSGR